MSKHFQPLLWLLLLLFAAGLLCFPGETAEAAAAGLSLCGTTIIPALFPFFVLTTLVVSLGLAEQLGTLFAPMMERLFHLSGCCSAALMLGFIGGYPMGARTTAALYRQGLCSRREAVRLLCFCNNAGPAFLLGVAGSGVFRSSGIGILLLVIHLVSALCIGLLSRLWCAATAPTAQTAASPSAFSIAPAAAFTAAIQSAAQAILHISAFVVFFQVLLRLLNLCGALRFAAGLLSLTGLPPTLCHALFSGLLELTSGITLLTTGGMLPLRLCVASFLLGWGGACVQCQTMAVLADSGLPLAPVLCGKLLHGILAAILTALVLALT